MGAVEVDPGLHPLQVLEHPRAVDDEVAHHRELRHRLEGDRLAVRRDLIDERGARLADLAVDEHRARAADLLEARRTPRRPARPSFRPPCRGAFCISMSALMHVHLRLVGDLELLPARRVFGPIGPVLPSHPQLHQRDSAICVSPRPLGLSSLFATALAAPACSYLRARGLTRLTSTSSVTWIALAAHA